MLQCAMCKLDNQEGQWYIAQSESRGLRRKGADVVTLILRLKLG